VLVVFSTNLDPADLADEAFLRRIHTKIYVEAVDARSFDEIFARVVKAKQIPTEQDSAEYLRKLCLRDGRTECAPVTRWIICNILQSIGQYERRAPKMTKPELERATALYFAKG